MTLYVVVGIVRVIETDIILGQNLFVALVKWLIATLIYACLLGFSYRVTRFQYD